MPKVTAEHREARRAQILSAARRCFLRAGFHRTSMADVLAEADLSAGAVYRYFPSKDAIVAAIAKDAVGSIAVRLEPLLRQEPLPPLRRILGEAVSVLDPLAGPDGVARIAVQVWAEALHDDTLRPVVSDALHELRDWFVRLARRAQAERQLGDEVAAEEVGMALFSFLPGYLLQRLFTEDVTAEAYLRGVTAILGGCAAAAAASRS